MIKSPKIAFLGKMLLCCGIALLAYLVVTGWRPRSNSPQQLDIASLVRDDGFNFDLVLKSNDWNGPRVGDSIDTTKMVSRSGQSLYDALKKQELTMLIVVDPTCGTCTKSTSYMKQVRDQMAQLRIPYNVTGFVPSQQPSAFYDYADLLKLDSPSYRWDYQATQLPISLEKMIVPTHLLIDRRQVIRGLWPGGGNNTLVTGKMLQQITADATKIASAQK
jgi:hypothetical protein